MDHFTMPAARRRHLLPHIIHAVLLQETHSWNDTSGKGAIIQLAVVVKAVGADGVLG